MKWNKYLVRYSELNIRGDKRVIKEKEVNAPSPKDVREHMHRMPKMVGARVNMRVLKITKIGGPYESGKGGWL